MRGSLLQCSYVSFFCNSPGSRAGTRTGYGRFERLRSALVDVRRIDSGGVKKLVSEW
jgi:hypothetical protein